LAPLKPGSLVAVYLKESRMIYTPNMKAVTILCTLLLTICSNESYGVPIDKTDVLNRVDVCDARKIVGTCLEYTLSELDDWYLEFVQKSCPRYKRGQLIGIYKKNARCPSENRVARCEGIIEDPAERYEYDKHYYVGTADNYSWQPNNVQVSCKNVSGHFVPE
jgi:hypothetical protein